MGVEVGRVRREPVVSLGVEGQVGSCVGPNLPVTSRPTYFGNRYRMGNRGLGDGRSRFERQWQMDLYDSDLDRVADALDGLGG